MKILVMGAGTIGAYYGARLQQAGRRGGIPGAAKLRAMRERGLAIKSIEGDFTLPRVTATDDPAQFAPYD